MNNNSAPARILIVDDLPENLLALDALIRGDDRTIMQASSGEQALALLLENEFALAILDVQMPGMNGFELAEFMRGTDKTRGIPIIFVSAAGKEQNYAFKGYESGAVDFLHKPLDAHAVKSKVNVFVDLHHQRGALLATRQELERAVKMRDDFMSMVSHELRTPLNTLFLQTQIRKMNLEKGNPTALSPDQLRQAVERDQRQIQNMVKLIDDMLDVSRLRRGALAIWPKPTDLALLVRRVVDGFAEQAASAGCEISLKAPPALSGVWDEFRIEQVVANLLTNATRYGAGKSIDVVVEAVHGGARLTVRDYGRGVAPEDSERIFGQFERAVEKDQVPGLGLGLYITRQILAAHGGTITVNSALGQGATFVVTLPLDSSSAKGE
ncbi:MAG: hybrid sensor histidine kinase/response regulator [Comamonadaceae bacterium]|nr:MAG: hybrid sensor histidine kinase/response regulator [Comamonadaceae bacterium]